MERADEPKLFFESLFERVVNIRTLVAHPVILQLAWEKGFHNIFGKIVLWWTLILSSLSQLRNPIFGLVSKNMANSRQNKPTQEQDAPENNNCINPYCVHAPLIPPQSGLSSIPGWMVPEGHNLCRLGRGGLPRRRRRRHPPGQVGNAQMNTMTGLNIQ